LKTLSFAKPNLELIAPRSGARRLFGKNVFASLEMPPDALKPEGVLGMSGVFGEGGEVAPHFEVTLIEGLQVFAGGLHLFVHDISKVTTAQHRGVGGNLGTELLFPLRQRSECVFSIHGMEWTVAG
jgi:hypothetical protein